MENIYFMTNICFTKILNKRKWEGGIKTGFQNETRFSNQIAFKTSGSPFQVHESVPISCQISSWAFQVKDSVV